MIKTAKILLHLTTEQRKILYSWFEVQQIVNRELCYYWNKIEKPSYIKENEK